MTNLVENAFALSTHLLKDTLHKVRNKEPIDGYLNVLYNGKSAALDYTIEYDNEKTYLVVAFGPEPQKILLFNHELTYGTRTYLTCACGIKVNALYLNKGVFACRKCQKLHYASTAINRSSKHGKFLFQHSQVLRLITVRESMDRIFYRSRFTKRFERWLELCRRAGMTNEVNDAQALISAINAHQQQV